MVSRCLSRLLGHGAQRGHAQCGRPGMTLNHKTLNPKTLNPKP
jgi:hypothetical protein